MFAGKPVPLRDEGWIGKGIRGISILLQLHNHACSVLLSFQGEDRLDRRAKIIELFPETEYTYELRESPKFANIVFPGLDKGKKDHDHWPEIRENLTTLGEEVYNCESAGIMTPGSAVIVTPPSCITNYLTDLSIFCQFLSNKKLVVAGLVVMWVTAKQLSK